MTKPTPKIALLALSTALTGWGAAGALADIVHADDVIIDGSLCVGFNCINNESFGSDTIRLKEDNLRIHFDDTSSIAGFPARDWRIVINDSTSGGASYFGIEDTTGGRRVMTIEAGAPTNSLYVDDGGRVGIGTSTPVVEAHISNGDSPTLRLEQNGSSGFTAQTWDIAGNETNFFVRDVTGGSTLPFRIRPDAPSSSIDIAGDGDVGVGTASPAAALHVNRSTGASTELLRLTNNNAVFMGLEDGSVAAGNNTGRIWNIQNVTGQFRITTAPGGSTEQELTLDAAGNLVINGTITTSGSCSGGCDRVFDATYDLASIDDHSAFMWANRHLPAVGPTAEAGPMNLSDKVGGILNELEKAHIYIDQLNRRVAELEASAAVRDN